MDNFAEQLVKKEKNSADKAKTVLTYVFGILITVLLVVFAFLQMGTVFCMLGLILAVGSGYGTYFIGQNSYIEYEYTFTNGELDIDKIIAKKKRIELITAETRKFTAFGKYTDDLEESEDMTVVLSSDNIASHEYYADFEHPEHGSTRLIFSPNEKMLESIRRALPGKLRNSQ
ncbi:MAG: hypothetical protein IKM49_05815 [Ruminococcus sp.]|nr:hypothetical protein [Ruminococcus sp.]